MAEDPWAAFRVKPAGDAAPAADPWADFRPKAAAPAPTVALPETDALGNPTGGTVEAPRIGEAPESKPGPGGVGTAVVRGLVNGIPVVGPTIVDGVNRAAAGARALTSGKSYDEELAHVRQNIDGAAKEYPIASTVGEVGGGIVGTLPLIAAAPAAFGAGAGGLVGRSAASLATGAALGGADTAARTGADGAETAKGAAMGAALGGVSPGLGQLAGRAMAALGEKIAALRAPVPGLGNEAAGKLATDLKNAGGADAVRARLADLGPDAMLLDAGPSFEGRAQGLAVLPDTREAVMRPLTERGAGANARLARDLEAKVGPATDPATFARTIDTEYERVVPPLYAKAFAEPVQVDTSRTLATVDGLRQREKGGAAQALDRAWGLLHTEAELPGIGRVMVPDRNPEALHNAKEALDAAIAQVRAQQGSAARSELRALTMTRQSLNAALESDVPGYAMANRTAQRFFERREAFDRGQTVLNGGRDSVRPAQLAEETAAMAPEVAEAQRLGLRAELDRLVGTKQNDRVALADAVKGEGDWNRARLATVLGEEPTEGVVGAVERERAFAASQHRVNDNAMTELRKRAADDVAPRDLAPGSGDLGTVVAGLAGGPAGVAAAGAVRGAKLGANVIGRDADLARNRELAQAVTMIPGEALDALLTALGKRGAANDQGALAGPAAERLVNALLQSQGDRGRRMVPSGSRGQ